MTTGHVFIATSLDGYIARSDGNLDWLMGFSAAGEDHGYDGFMATIDGLIMGRGTYEKVLTFGAWPYPKPVVVVSSSLTESDLRDDLVGKVEVHRGPPAEVMQYVAEKGWSRA